MWDFSSSWDHAPHCYFLTQSSKPWVDASELFVSCTRTETEVFPLYRLGFCIHQCSSALAYFDWFNCLSRDLFPKFAGVIWPCTATTAVDDNCPINLLSSLTVTSDWRSLHRIFIFSTFSCGRLSVILCQSTNLLETPKSLWNPILAFEFWLKTPSSEAEILMYPKQLVVPLKRLPSGAYRLDILQFLYKVSEVKL